MLAMFGRKLGLSMIPNNARFIAWRDSKGVQGGFMYERYTGPGGIVHMHWAADRPPGWLSRAKLQLAFAYPFGQLRVRACIGDIEGKNTYVQDLCEKLGGREIARISDYFPEDALVLYRMDRQDCRWLPPGMTGMKGESDG
jgi:hypothetical protein